MFRAGLSAKLKRIFDLDKVTYDMVSDSREQECAFIEVGSTNCKIKEKREMGRVSGRMRVFANADKLPYGYFAKKIQAADYEDTKDLFFFDFEENAGTFQNICERSLSFIYFYSGQYNPEVGSMTSIELEVAE